MECVFYKLLSRNVTPARQCFSACTSAKALLNIRARSRLVLTAHIPSILLEAAIETILGITLSLALAQTQIYTQRIWRAALVIDL